VHKNKFPFQYQLVFRFFFFTGFIASDSVHDRSF